MDSRHFIFELKIKMRIDLRSDTITQPTAEMKTAMMQAKLGDDVFHEDPSVNELEEFVADMFGKEKALFCPSGTMTNQIAIKVHTQPGDEIICDRSAHIYNYEGGGIGFNSGASVRLIEGDLGRFTLNDVIENINPDNDHYPRTAMVSIENTVNRGGGSIWNIAEIERISTFCSENNLKIHLDGARLFNALTETHETCLQHGSLFDSLSLCLSKGLGAPAGSVLCGDSYFIDKARRIRKVFGGGMRQAGILASAGIYALKHHVHRLKDDHLKAKILAKHISETYFCLKVLPVETNILIFELKPEYKTDVILRKLAENNIYALNIGKQRIRMVTHLDFTDLMLEKACEILKLMS